MSDCERHGKIYLPKKTKNCFSLDEENEKCRILSDKMTNPQFRFRSRSSFKMTFSAFIVILCCLGSAKSQFSSLIGNLISQFTTQSQPQSQLQFQPQFQPQSQSQFQSASQIHAQTPQSPCPQTFQYQSNGYEVYGIGKILPGQYDLGSDIQVNANLVVGTHLPTNYYGKIQFTGTPENIVNQMYSNEPIQFEIKFPTQDPLPTVQSIVVNGNFICSGNQYSPQNSQYTKIQLKYLFQAVLGNYRPRPSIATRPNNIFTQQTPPQPKPPQNQPQFHIYNLDFPQSTTAAPSFVSPNPIPYSTTPANAIIHLANPSNVGVEVRREELTSTTPDPGLITRNQGQPKTNYELGCGKIPRTYNPLVFGGTTIEKGDWPFIAALHHYAQSSLKFKCGATIISRTTIISAAHCFFDRKKRLGSEEVLAFVGHLNLKRLQEEGSRIINLASVIIHPEYGSQSKLYSDIAVGKLSETLTYSEFIQPACLWTGASDQSLIVGRNGVIVGWGVDETGVTTAEPKRVEVPVVSHHKCLQENEGFVRITSDRTFCAGWRNGSEGPCRGDSGSGLMLTQDGMWFLRGLVSVSAKDFNTGLCDLNEFVVFTDVAQFVPWITSLL